MNQAGPSSRTAADIHGASPLRAQDRLVLYSTVVLTGGAVMVLELLGTRIIGPFYGVSLYVWSSLIAVTMFALALGYFLGGWGADRFPEMRLTHLLLLAALGTLLIPVCSGPVLLWTDRFGIGGGALASALVLFAPALTCLGMAGPYVIKLATRRLEGVGTVSGSVYAVSTLGSVAATLLLGFYLLPLLGTRAILQWTGGLLCLLALGLAIHERQGMGRRQLVLAAALVSLAVAALAFDVFRAGRHVEGFAVRSDAESVYGWVRVVDDQRRGIRLLLSDASTIGAQTIDTGRTMLAYQEFLDLLPLLEPRSPRTTPRKALLIGLGSGHVATQLKAAGIVTDTIEIDPAVADAALKHFGFRPTGAFLVGDGRYEIRKLRPGYDLIILDCFTGGTEPVHLLTRETFVALKALLAEGGVVALNFVGFARGDGSEAVASVATTIAGVFSTRRVFVTLPKEAFTDFIFLASDHSIRFEPRSEAERQVVGLLEQHETSTPTAGAIQLTDDFNPLEHMQVRKTAMYRALFLERVAPELLLR